MRTNITGNNAQHLCFMNWCVWNDVFSVSSGSCLSTRHHVSCNWLHGRNWSLLANMCTLITCTARLFTNETNKGVNIETKICVNI